MVLLFNWGERRQIFGTYDFGTVRCSVDGLRLRSVQSTPCSEVTIFIVFYHSLSPVSIFRGGFFFGGECISDQLTLSRMIVRHSENVRPASSCRTASTNRNSFRCTWLRSRCLRRIPRRTWIPSRRERGWPRASRPVSDGSAWSGRRRSHRVPTWRRRGRPPLLPPPAWSACNAEAMTSLPPSPILPPSGRTGESSSLSIAARPRWGSALSPTAPVLPGK